MLPAIKWPGGKRREIKKILDNIPKNFDVIVEPFFGGGAFSLHLVDEKEIYGSDIDLDLVKFYKNIKSRSFQRKLKSFSDWWDNECKINEFPKSLDLNFENIKEINRKSDKHIIYYAIRNEYNHLKVNDIYNINRSIYYFLLRELSFSSMFRFNSFGEFNVPYGGFAYNKKSFLNKYKIIKELSLKKISVQHRDFLSVIEDFKNDQNNLIFLDPPYDSVFKNYNSNSFGRNDHIRLRDSLMNSNAKILMIINDTDYIRGLYEENFNITSYDKKYSVNFKNRNNQNVKHLVITNY